MACGKTVFFLLAILASSACVLADESTDPSSQDIPQEHGQNHLSHEDHHSRAGLFNNNGGLPNLFSSFGGSNQSNPLSQFFERAQGSDPFSQIISAFTQFIPGFGSSNSSGFPNLFSAFLPQSGRSQQLEQLPSDLDTGDFNNSSPHDRFFFFHHFFTSNVPIGCNYTTQAGYSCAGCREQLLCNSNNVGRIRICPFYAPYCFNGVCGSTVNTTCTNSTG